MHSLCARDKGDTVRGHLEEQCTKHNVVDTHDPQTTESRHSRNLP
jgi:hypothetical protein